MLRLCNRSTARSKAAIAIAYPMKAFWLYLMQHDTQEILLAFLETGLVFVMTRVFQEGVHVLLKERMIAQLSEEKVMGLAFLGAFFLLGIPDIVVAGFSIILAITAFVTLLCSYCFGLPVLKNALYEYSL